MLWDCTVSARPPLQTLPNHQQQRRQQVLQWQQKQQCSSRSDVEQMTPLLQCQQSKHATEHEAMTDHVPLSSPPSLQQSKQQHAEKQQQQSQENMNLPSHLQPLSRPGRLPLHTLMQPSASSEPWPVEAIQPISALPQQARDDERHLSLHESVQVAASRDGHDQGSHAVDLATADMAGACRQPNSMPCSSYETGVHCQLSPGNVQAAASVSSSHGLATTMAGCAAVAVTIAGNMCQLTGEAANSATSLPLPSQSGPESAAAMRSKIYQAKITTSEQLPQWQNPVNAPNAVPLCLHVTRSRSVLQPT